MVVTLLICNLTKTVKIAVAVNNQGTLKDMGDEPVQENNLTTGNNS